MFGSVLSDFGDAFIGRHVRATGYTGFKGGWISHWLKQTGAGVSGIFLAPVSEPNLCNAIGLTRDMASRLIDIRNRDRLLGQARDLDADLVIDKAARLMSDCVSFAGPWKLGPDVSDTVDVHELAVLVSWTPQNAPSLAAR